MSTAHDSLKEFMNAVLRKMPTIITMPSSNEEFRVLANQFYTYGYPNVVGAIDGTMIEVKPPEENRIDYFSRKYITAVNLTALCDANKKFLNINVGHSARCHDSHIFQRSKLYNMISNKQIPTDYHIIGDAAYGLNINIMVPYPGESLSGDQELHNKRHSSTRMVVERCFADLKNRWLRLHNMRCDLEFGNKIIAVCCCLHNICLQHGDIEPSVRPAPPENIGYHQLQFENATEKRDAIANHLQNN